MKRVMDISLALVGLILHAPLFVIIAIAIKLDSRGPIFFLGERMGKDGKPFHIYKYRTMIADAPQRGGGITVRDDPRITRVGRFLRRTKFDELPQFFNVLKGDMSLVGPRPEDPRYLPYYSPRQRQVLTVRPGLTSIASIRYRNEDQLLLPEEWEKVYTSTILPTKLDLELNYLASRSVGQDFLILTATFFALLKDESLFDRLTGGITLVERALKRYMPWVIVDANLILLSYILAVVVRSINAQFDLSLAFLTSVFVVTVYTGANHLFGVYHRIWHYASAQEAVILFMSATVSTVILSVIDWVLPAHLLPLGAVWLGGFFSFVFMAAVRYRARLTVGLQRLVDDVARMTSSQGARVLIVGAGEEGQLLAWQLQTSFQERMFQVIGFVDNDPIKQGMWIHNARVHGGDQKIPELVTELRIDLIIIAIPLHRLKEPRELLALCRATSAQIKILPTLFDWLGQGGSSAMLKDLNDDDLLQRATYHVDEGVCSDLIKGKVVLVTGAAGSIGSELTCQIAGYQPRLLIIVDINESGLYDLRTELQAKYKDVSIMLYLGDISNVDRMKAIFQLTQPQIVFHVAAYKHVPILEDFPEEAIRVNVYGTRVLHTLAAEHHAERFVLISSDKAVNPQNVLGQTKWLGELIVTAPAKNSKMLSAAVRFGNVLGSRGSVVPTFQKQIAMGGPITITDPRMTRYFLAIDEAMSLVIQAAAMTKGGDLFILDMGTPINIMDLAHRMIRQYGLRPGQDIKIAVVGSRPGEKISEELIAADEEKLPSAHPSIFRIRRTKPINPAQLETELNRIVAYLAQPKPAPEILAGLRYSIQTLANSARSPTAPECVTAPEPVDAAPVPGWFSGQVQGVV